MTVLAISSVLGQADGSSSSGSGGGSSGSGTASDDAPSDGSSGGTSDTGDSTSPVGDSSCEAGSDSEFLDPNCTAGDSFSPEDRPARKAAPRAEAKPGQAALATLAVLLFLIVFTAWIAVGIRRGRGGAGP